MNHLIAIGQSKELTELILRIYRLFRGSSDAAILILHDQEQSEWKTLARLFPVNSGERAQNILAYPTKNSVTIVSAEDLIETPPRTLRTSEFGLVILADIAGLALHKPRVFPYLRQCRELKALYVLSLVDMDHFLPR